MYAFFRKLQKELADAEIALWQLQAGQKVKKEQIIYTIVPDCEKYVEEITLLTYLQKKDHNIKIWVDHWNLIVTLNR